MILRSSIYDLRQQDEAQRVTLCFHPLMSVQYKRLYL